MKKPISNRYVFAHTSRDSKQQSQVQKHGIYLWKKIFERNRDYGGYMAYLQGSMGTGKTSLCLCVADQILEKFPQEIVYWREPPLVNCQFVKLHAKEKARILCDREYPLQLCEVQPDGYVPVNDGYKIVYFSGVKQALSLSKPNRLNVIYFHPDRLYNWVEIINHHKLDGRWETIIIDEAEDIFPNRCSDKQWHHNERLAMTAKEVRKAHINLFFNSQSKADCDWRVVNKRNLTFMCRGTPHDTESPVTKKALSKLKVGQCYIDLNHAEFGRINFKPYLPCTKEYVMVPEVLLEN